MMAECKVDIGIAGKLKVLELRNILRDYFTVNVIDFKRQGGYDNQTYIVTAQDIDGRDDGAGDTNEQPAGYMKYVLKVFHEEFVNNIENVEMQSNMMIHLNKNSITSSKPKLTVDGAPFLTYKHSDGKTHVIQLLSYIEGEVVYSANLTAEEYKQVAHLTGQYIAKVQKALKSFQCSASPRIPNPFYMDHLHMVADKFSSVQDQTMGDLIRKLWMRIERNLIPKLGIFEEGFIHGDFSDMNVAIRKTSIEGNWQIAGLIDFEDCHYGFLIADLACCLAYFMARAMLIPKCDPVAVAARVIIGYETISSLKDFDKEVLYEVVTSRLIVSYVMACYNVKFDPDNEEYLFIQAAQIPSLLKLLDSLEEGSVMHKWFGKEGLSRLCI